MKRSLDPMRLWQLLVIALLLALVIGIYGIVALLFSGQLEGQAPDVRVLSPHSGTLVTVGQTIRVQAEASGAVPVLRFGLVDADRIVATTDDVRALDKNIWTATQEWRAESAGIHPLTVRAMDVSQHIGTSSVITMFVAPKGQLAFASNRTGRYQLYTMLTNGEGLTTLSVNELNQREPSWSRNGTLAFLTIDAAGNADIWARRAQTSEQLTRNAAPRSHPAWSPQGDALAFGESRQGGNGLYIWNLKDPATQLVGGGGFEDVASPAWSPDGRRLAFMGSRNRNADIYVVNRDGSGLIRLTSGPSQDWQPAWSPNSNDIAFVSNRSGSHQIYVMRADGSSPVRLTDFAGGAEQPAWSLDGMWLAFVAYTGLGPRLDAREIYVMRRDGSDPMRITSNAYDDTDPIWTP